MSVVYNLCLFTMLLSLAACSSHPVEATSSSQNTLSFAAPRLPASMGETRRSTASAGNDIYWMPHPCPTLKSAPFKKYEAFGFDEQQGKVFARAKGKEQPIELTQKPKGSAFWTSLAEFFDQQGITQACGAADAKEAPQPTKQERKQAEREGTPTEKPQRNNSKFVTPLANPAETYYAALTGYDQVLRTKKTEITFFDKLSVLTGSPHIQEIGQSDVLVETCEQVNAQLKPSQVCVMPVRHNYAEARMKMMGDLDLREVSPGVYEVFDHYCQMWMGEAQFKQSGVATDFPGPNKITHNRVTNCEHTWPQSKFPAAEKLAAELEQKTDLHHIFSTNSKINNTRANFDFGDVDQANSKSKHSTCLGQAAEGTLGPVLPVADLPTPTEPSFEPPKAHKGNVARALFYFSTRYRVKMPPVQEYYLRRWHRDDPVDEMEAKRNERAYQLSGVRNPFVDHPEYVEQIASFSR